MTPNVAPSESEATWLAAHDSRTLTLLDSLRDVEIANRKLRLFAIGCCRQIWHLLSEGDRRAIEIAQSDTDADGQYGHFDIGQGSPTPSTTDAQSAVAWTVGWWRT